MPFFICLGPIVALKQKNNWREGWVFISSFIIDTNEHNSNNMQTADEKL